MRQRAEQFVQDLIFAGRSFRRSPAFTLVALLSLMLGIGATTAIFSVIYGILIAPYPYARPGEIWAPGVRPLEGRGGHNYTAAEVQQMSQLSVFSDVMATSIETALLTGNRVPETFSSVLLTGNAFNFLGVPPVVGRTLQPSDLAPDGTAAPVAVLSYRLWQRLFDGRADAVGQTLVLNNVPHTVVGVMPPRFGWYGNESMWRPLSLSRRDLPFLAPIVRLAPGVSHEAARGALDALNRHLAQAQPADFPARGFRTELTNYLDITVASGEMQTSLKLLLGAVAFLLLIACANVANLQLARGSARAREMAVRLSIGADRKRLVRQLLTESVLLSLAGCVAGVLFAYLATKTIVALMPEFYVPNEARVTINVLVLLFSLAVSLVTGIAFGLVPALQTSRTDVTAALKASRSTGAGHEGGRTRNVLVVAEVALSVVLLVSAGLTFRTFVALQNTDTGIHADRVLFVGVPLAPTRYSTMQQRNDFGRRLLEEVSTLPGVEAATFGTPFGGPQSPIEIPGVASDSQRRVTVYAAGPGYLRTFGVPLRGGRMFDEGEVLRGEHLALINEAAARLWPEGRSPIGSTVQLSALMRQQGQALVDVERGGDVTIVGIAANTRNGGIKVPPVPALIIPYSLVAPPQRVLAVRSASDPASLINAIRARLRAMDPEQPLGRPRMLDEVLDAEVIQPRFTMALFTAFAALGLALAAAGIYSVLSFHVARRTHELGVRMALGASRRSVLALMLKVGGRLVVIGLAIGIPISLLATRMLQSQLFGVKAADPLSYAMVTAVLAVVAFAACLLPARRAANVDPMIALRQE